MYHAQIAAPVAFPANKRAKGKKIHLSTLDSYYQRYQAEQLMVFGTLDIRRAQLNPNYEPSGERTLAVVLQGTGTLENPLRGTDPRS